MSSLNFIHQTKEKDHIFIKNLLEASEKHNKNLTELIVILKKNIEEEKYKYTRFAKENTDLKKDLILKQQLIKKLENELSYSKQNEQKQQIVIKSLQESFEKQKLQQKEKTKFDEQFQNNMLEDYNKSSQIEKKLQNKRFKNSQQKQSFDSNYTTVLHQNSSKKRQNCFQNQSLVNPNSLNASSSQRSQKSCYFKNANKENSEKTIQCLNNNEGYILQQFQDCIQDVKFQKGVHERNSNMQQGNKYQQNSINQRKFSSYSDINNENKIQTNKIINQDNISNLYFQENKQKKKQELFKNPIFIQENSTKDYSKLSKYLKNEEDVTVIVEELQDTMANVEEDADEAANLENLNGSHFKVNMKNSCKYLRIKTDQYFSKIENRIISNLQNNELKNADNSIKNAQTNTTLKEPNKTISEKHQSVNNYNQINNKLSNFKAYSNSSKKNMIENVLERKIKSQCGLYDKKEPGKIKKSLEENQNNFLGNQIFECLMIFGPNKVELNSIKQTKSKQIFTLKPEIYFKHPEHSQIEKGREDVFQQFAFPFGVETQQYSLSDSLSEVNQIIFTNNIAEANNNCFVFAIKSEESYKFQKNNNSKQNEYQELLEICNPSNLLYGICFRVKEVIENNQKNYFWTTNKLFCFLTYYPFHKFFLDIISSMLNQMKMKRIEYYSSISEKMKHNTLILSKLENEFFMNFINNECKQLLDELKKIVLPKLSTTLQLQFNQENFIYQIPSRELAKHIEAEWGCSIVLSSLDLDVFISIFLSLLLEQSIVFVSNNAALLSSTVLLFHSLLKPFQWPHPLIINLPNNFTHIMDIPIPILIGLNKDKAFIFEKKLDSEHENCLFVLLDDKIQILNSHLLQTIHKTQSFQKAKKLKKKKNILFYIKLNLYLAK